MSFVVTEPVVEGSAVIKTTVGDILVELWRRECPKAVRNFIQLALEGHYDGVAFDRVVPGFIAQTGGSNDCIYDEGEFGIETNQRLKFNRRGLLAMASDPLTKTNASAFFFTLDATPDLQNKHTLFGRVAGDSLFNLLKLNEVELESGTDRPVYPPVIKSIEIRDDPFEDSNEPITPRITAAERKEQEKAKKEMKIERAKQREQGKRKGTKNKSLISFGDEAEAEETESSALPKTKFKSAHDAPGDGRLSAKVLDDRGLSAEVPAELLGPGAAAAAASAKRRKGDDEPDRGGRDEKRSRADEPAASTSRLDEARRMKEKEKKAAPKSEAEKRKEEIARVQAELKKMSGKPTSDDEDTASSKKKKRTGPSLLQLERDKYLRGGASSSSSTSTASRGKRKANDEDDVLSVLDSFRSKLIEAARSAPGEMDVDEAGEDDAERREKLHGIDLNDDEMDDDDAGWLTHALKFRKDATLDQHHIDEYAVVDPLAKNTHTLDEMRGRAEAQRRKYAGEGSGRDRERGDERRGGGGGSSRYGGGGGGGDRYGGGGGGSRGGDRDRYGGGGRSDRRDSGRDRPEVRGDWKKDRVSTADLA
ncbi:hypothetical protein JCM10207_005010 [Rhodosporidiobolus poonsookiae]